jgi:3-dehydroquinate synthase II
MQNTRYLSELKAGDEVLIVDRQGNVRTTNVGRAKIEFRPLMLIEAEAQGKQITAILQNAETIRLVTPNDSKPVTELKVGDEVLVHVAAPGGRHFGISVPEEKVIER